MRAFGILAMTLTAAFVASAAAQTTQPVDAPVFAPSDKSVASVDATHSPMTWQQTVETFGDALSDGSASSFDALLSEDAVIRPFGSKSTRATLDEFRDRVGRFQRVATLSYCDIPQTLAGDLTAAMRDASIPDSVKSDLIVPDEAATKRANQVAAAWMTQALALRPGDPVALLVLYPKPDDALPGHGDLAPPAPRSPIFVLVKGIADPSAGGFHIRQILFGEPRSAAD